MTIMSLTADSHPAEGRYNAGRQDTTANSGEQTREQAEERRWQAEWDRRNVED